MRDADTHAHAPPIVYPTHARPIVEVYSRGCWLLAELRMWREGLDGWRAEVQRIRPGQQTRVETVPADRVRAVETEPR